jgi:hypothetical protein
MASRTFEGKHTTRFIIEVKGESGIWNRSYVHNKFYATRELANIALSAGEKMVALKYRVRMK